MCREIHDTALAREQIMLDLLCAEVKRFYENPLNRQAYEAWKKKQEANYATNNNNGRFDPGKP